MATNIRDSVLVFKLTMPSAGVLCFVGMGLNKRLVAILNLVLEISEVFCSKSV